ncbi:hypothetical protein K8S17_06400, partial [bacterium]|nr:hypothetical protein [bacterium]
GSGYLELWVILATGNMSQIGHSFSQQPLDMDVYPSGPSAGNLIVLLDEGSEDAYLAQLERTGDYSFNELDPIATTLCSSPTAFSIMPDGTIILIDYTDGMFTITQGGALVPFGYVYETGWTDISVGADGTVYALNATHAEIHRYDQAGNELFPMLYAGAQPVALEAVAYTPTPPGSNVPVSPVADVEILFEEVTDGGYTSAEVTETSDRTSPGGNSLPDHAQPPGTRSDFTYISATTSAVYENLIQVDIYLAGSRFFVAHGTGGEFHDVTVVGSIEDARGVISRFDSPVGVPIRDHVIEGPSEFVLVEDTRATTDVVEAKFDRLIAILTGEEHSPSSHIDLVYARRHLLRRTLRAEDVYELGNELGAIAELALMNADIRSFAGKGIPNSSEDEFGNIAGEMLSRSKTLMFSLGLLVTPERGVDAGEAMETLALAAPNPVHGECRLQLSGPIGARAIAAVYNVSGRLVTTLFDGELENGVQELVWDGTDAYGRKVASGVYLTRAVAGAESVTGKLVYIR